MNSINSVLAITLLSAQALYATGNIFKFTESPESLFAVENGRVALVTDSGEPLYRWYPEAGKTSRLDIHPDHPLLRQLRYFDTLRFDFRIAEGEMSEASLLALGHVSGARQSRVHQWQVAVLTTPKKVWHKRLIELARPNWFPWDSADGTDGDTYLRFTTMALTPGTILEIRAPVLTRAVLRLKADFLPPESWPVLTRNADGSATYRLTHWLQNASGAPAVMTARLVSAHRRFRVGLLATNGEVDARPSPSLVLPMKHNERAAVEVVATLPAEDVAGWEELGAEELVLEFAMDTAPEAAVVWQGYLTRPLSTKLQRQVVIPPDELAAARAAIAQNPEGASRRLKLDTMRKTADALLNTEFLCLPRSSAHVRNGWVDDWRPSSRMPEIVNTATGEKETGTELAGSTWKEYLGQFGGGCASLTYAYLYTGDEAYARKAIELFMVHAREYRELPWTIQSESPWSQGDYILGASRIAWNSTYGSNWYYKDHCRLLSAISGAAAWTPEVAAKIYHGFIVPYALELMKFRGGLSNMTDITNHNIFLLGLVFDDANLVRWALLNDTGLLNRLSDITDDGFSSEGRPVSYHYGAMAEYLPTLAYVVRSGLKVDIPRQRLAGAMLMPYKRATLWGRIPSSGDCGRGLNAGPNQLANQMTEIVANVPELALAGRRPGQDANAWRGLLETGPRLFESAGLAILRSGGTPETQVMATLDYGRNVFHAHLDRNQITLMAFGKSFSMGPGSSYNVGSGGMVQPQHANLRAFCGGGSLGQNVIMADQRDQSATVGTLRGWSGDPARCWAAAEISGAHPGVRHERAILLEQGVVVVLDRASSGEEHTFDWLYHNLGTLQPGDGWKATPLAKPLATRSLYDKLVDTARLEGPAPLRATWDLTWNIPPAEADKLRRDSREPPPVRLAFWQLSTPGNEIYTAKTGINNLDSTRMPDTAPSLICRATGKNATWITVLEPYKEAPRVTGIEARGPLGVTVRLANGTTITAEWDKLANRPLAAERK